MRHRLKFRKLNRTSEHRRAMHRNLAQSLIEHGQVRTTLPKAKDLRPFVERIVTLAVQARRLASEGDQAGSLRARRRIEKVLGDRSIIAGEHRDAYWAMSDAHRNQVLRSSSGRRYRTGQPKGRLAFTGESVIHRLIERVASNYEDRPGGYTRVIKLPDRRKGDDAPLAILQFVGGEERPTALTKPGKTARQRRIDSRYRFAIKLTKGGKAKQASRPRDEEAPVAEGSEEAAGQVDDNPADPPAGEEKSE